jgi:peroxiredoxin
MTKGTRMSRWNILRKLSTFGFVFALGVAFAPRLVATAHAQDDEGEEGDGSNLTEDQKNELRSLACSMQKADESIMPQQGEDPDYDTGAKLYKKFVAKVEQSKLPEKFLQQMKMLGHYNYACCLSRTGVKDEAVKELEKSVQLGFFDWKHIAEDKDLDAVRDGDDFKKVVDDGKKLEVDKVASQVKSGKEAGKLSFETEDADGAKVTLAGYKGKVVVVAFLSAERDETIGGTIHLLNKAQESLKDQGVVVLGLVFGAEKDQLKGFGDKHKAKFPLAVGDPNDSVKAIAATGATLVIVDKAGKVRATAPAIYQAEVVTESVKPLVDEGGAPTPEPKKDDKKDKKEDF